MLCLVGGAAEFQFGLLPSRLVERHGSRIRLLIDPNLYQRSVVEDPLVAGVLTFVELAGEDCVVLQL
jgi:hypothetical protein